VTDLDDIPLLADQLNDLYDEHRHDVLLEAAAALRELGGRASLAENVAVLAPKPGELVVLKLRGNVPPWQLVEVTDQLRAAVPDGVRAIVLAVDGHLYGGAEADRVVEAALIELRERRR